MRLKFEKKAAKNQLVLRYRKQEGCLVFFELYSFEAGLTLASQKGSLENHPLIFLQRREVAEVQEWPLNQCLYQNHIPYFLPKEF